MTLTVNCLQEISLGVAWLWLYMPELRVDAIPAVLFNIIFAFLIEVSCCLTCGLKPHEDIFMQTVVAAPMPIAFFL